MLVAVTQMTSGGIIRENLAIAQNLIRRAANAGAKVRTADAIRLTT